MNTLAPVGEHESWATGKDPVVNSIYQRLLRQHSALKDHNYLAALNNGSKVRDMLDQLAYVAELSPVPDIFIIQSFGNDIRCDGTDEQNLKPLAATFTKVLQKIVKLNPNGRIYVVSDMHGRVGDYARFIERTPDARDLEMKQTGPCSLISAKGHVVPAHVAYLQQVVNSYEDVAAATCKRFRQCHDDHRALHNMPFRARDWSSDYIHMSIAGHKHAAAVLWKAFDWK